MFATLIGVTGSWSRAYDGDSSRVLTVTDPDGNVIAYEYDNSGQQTGMILNKGGTDVIDLDRTCLDGRLTGTTALDPLAQTTRTYAWTRLRPATAWQDDENRVISLEAAVPAVGSLRLTFTPRFALPAPSGLALGSFEASLFTDGQGRGRTKKVYSRDDQAQTWTPATEHTVSDTDFE